MFIHGYAVVGIGVSESDARPYLDKQKCINELQRLLPDETITTAPFCLDDYFYGEPFDDLGDFLCQMDDTGLLTYSYAGGESFCYYPPSYPWEMSNREPKREEDARAIIINALLRICNISREDADGLIHHICECDFG